ncbi:FAD-binding protein [Cohnella xylanilytica]|uniref:FAD-binding protein n=1 Tax=Cohnella xylanilytica TaxID=557555 RepID=A0A841U2W9_9BACL|nr:FAD-binding protein [Cohnella xylanilytica]MBB6694896.1 FAD-binding protein [Cohnella xylanilytica]
MSRSHNWAGNYTYNATELIEPEDVAQVRERVAASGRIKALGTRHSFNGIADSAGSHLSLAKLNRILELDRENGRVTVEGGVRYGELGHYLHDNGFALPNLASLPHITVAGACATGTHGSGDRNGSLATSVHAMEIVRADGSLASLSRDDGDETFQGAVVGLGALGVVTKLTLNVVPTFRVAQRVYEELPLARLEQGLDAIFSSAYSVSLFTDWKKDSINQVWVKARLTGGDSGPDSASSVRAAEAEAEFHGARGARTRLHPVPGLSADPCSEQLGVPGPWHERLPHFRMDFTPSAGEELQSEYFVPREQAYAALSAIYELREKISPLLYISEIRTIAEDNLWMSPCYKRNSAGIHFTWKPEWEKVREVLPLIERKLEPFEARPHWGKLFAMPPGRVQPLYEKLPEFRRLVREFDPAGKFRNAFLEEYILKE